MARRVDDTTLPNRLLRWASASDRAMRGVSERLPYAGVWRLR